MRYTEINNDYSIRFPDTIKVHEHKAPTDESIRLMEEMHQKAIQNIIAKVSVEHNLIKGKAFCCEVPCRPYDFQLVFKFQINGKTFTVEKIVNRHDVSIKDDKEIRVIKQFLLEEAKSVMLWYTLRMFAADTYFQITGKKLPERYI